MFQWATRPPTAPQNPPIHPPIPLSDTFPSTQTPPTTTAPSHSSFPPTTTSAPNTPPKKTFRSRMGKALRYSLISYHFSFPCEFHGERFSHGPGETSEPVSNPLTRRSAREGKKQSQIVPDVAQKGGKSQLTANNNNLKSPRSQQQISLLLPKHTVDRFGTDSECSSPRCLSACLSKGSPFF